MTPSGEQTLPVSASFEEIQAVAQVPEREAAQ